MNQADDEELQAEGISRAHMKRGESRYCSWWSQNSRNGNELEREEQTGATTHWWNLSRFHFNLSLYLLSLVTGQPLPAPDRHLEGRQTSRHGGPAAVYVQWWSQRFQWTIAQRSAHGPYAPGQRIGRRPIQTLHQEGKSNNNLKSPTGGTFVN